MAGYSLDAVKWEYVASGVYGEYFRAGKRVGVKVLKKNDLEEAETELSLLREAYKAGARGPRPFGLTYVNGRPAIVMEHIEGPTLYDCCLIAEINVWSLDEHVREEACENMPFDLCDLHSKNTIFDVRTGLFRPIDFSPDFIVE